MSRHMGNPRGVRPTEVASPHPPRPTRPVRRAEDEHEAAPTLRHGHADARADGGEGDEWPVAQLWLPNPDGRRGWELRHVYPHKDESRRAWGFGKERR